MLKFLQNQTSNRIPIKPLVNYKPELIYGHTEQSPNQFKNKFTIYYNKKSDEINQKQQQSVTLHVHNKTIDQAKKVIKQKNIQNIDHFQNNLKKIHFHRRNQSDFQVYEKIKPINLRNEEFKLSKGEFTNFLDKNKHNNKIAIIHRQYIDKQSKDEFLKKSSSTHQFSWNKSVNISSKYDHTSSTLSRFSNLLSQNSNSIQKQKLHIKQNSALSRCNSISIFQKKQPSINILRQKVQLYKQEKKNQVINKLQSKYANFGLPKIGVNHEIFLLDKKRFVKNEKKNEEGQINQQIQKFQHRLFRKFK